MDVVTAQDYFYIALGTGFLVLVGFGSFTVFRLSRTVDKLTSILTKVDEIAADANELKNVVKSGLVYLKTFFARKGGDKHGSK